MNENEQAVKAESQAEKALTPEEIREQIQKRNEEIKKRSKEATEAMGQGKGVLHLEAPIKSRDEELDELAYDFTALTGLEYTDAMDSDPNAQQIYRITYRQGLALFAKAAAKQTPGVDMRDIMERIGVTDAGIAVQIATLFFSASTRAGRLRISKKL